MFFLRIWPFFVDRLPLKKEVTRPFELSEKKCPTRKRQIFRNTAERTANIALFPPINDSSMHLHYFSLHLQFYLEAWFCFPES